MKNSEMLRRAAQELRDSGWTTGTEGMQTTGPACLMGAIGRVAGLDATMTMAINSYDRVNGVFDTQIMNVINNFHVALVPAAVALAEYMVENDMLNDGCWNSAAYIFNWNDHYAQDADEVIDLLERVAVLCEAEEAKADTRIEVHA